MGLEFQADLDGGIFSVALRQEFAAHHIFFADTPAPVVSVQDTGRRWLISQPVVTFLVVREMTGSTSMVGRQFWVHEVEYMVRAPP